MKSSMVSSASLSLNAHINSMPKLKCKNIVMLVSALELWAEGPELIRM